MVCIVKIGLFLFKYFYRNYNISDINCFNEIVGLAAFLENVDCPVMNNVTDEALNQIELEKYVSLPFISLDADPLQWWKLYHSQLPTVSLLAMKYLCIPGTSVPSERIFSSAGNIITDHRSLLSPGHAEELIFLSMNSKFISK